MEEAKIHLQEYGFRQRFYIGNTGLHQKKGLASLGGQRRL